MITTYLAVSALDMNLRHLGIPVLGVTTNADGSFTVQYAPSATAGQIAQGNQIASTWPKSNFQTRALVPIRNDLNALPLAKRQAIFNDLWAIPSGQAETRLLLDNGPNAPAIWSFYMWNEIGILNSTQLTTNQTYVTCLYVQDLPYYLVNPPFDPTISIQGLEPVS